jgi:hypothetical protein
MPMKQKTTKSRKRKMDNAMDDPLATKREYVVVSSTILVIRDCDYYTV